LTFGQQWRHSSCIKQNTLLVTDKVFAKPQAKAGAALCLVMVSSRIEQCSLMFKHHYACDYVGQLQAYIVASLHYAK